MPRRAWQTGGSIPAHTGEPLGGHCWAMNGRVYPRAYGGTRHPAQCVRRRYGLSPRIRGNPNPRPGDAVYYRSIPAHTGEPCDSDLTMPARKVYPRAYGGTFTAFISNRACKGLSPRIRGNQRSNPGTVQCQRSIPAHTGEPPEYVRNGSPLRVYPRAYGGTGSLVSIAPIRKGLSPRIRGNPRIVASGAERRRSIPAHTGEPVAVRVRTTCLSGLSPRIRGNLPASQADHVIRGSIPAHTGEPASKRCFCNLSRVYPRAYGGTPPGNRTSFPSYGLSPRIRGNLNSRRRKNSQWRSIPAHTGEPIQVAPSRSRTAVYPRAYGGTYR